MGEHVEHEVETVFTGKDLISGTLNRIIGAGARVAKTFDHASHMLGGFASVAAVVGGGFSLEKAVESTKEYLRSIDRVSMLTGMSTQHTDGLLESMEKVGIEGETAERILLGMSRKSAGLEMHMNAMGQSTGTTAQMLARMGINLKKGPIDALEGMAKAVQKNRLGVGELGIAFGVPRTQTIALYKMLQKGPEYIRDNIREAEKLGVTVSDLGAFRRMQEAQHEIGAAWKRINVIVGSELMPIIADLLKGGADKMKGWIEHAREFGKTMGHFLRDHYQIVLKIGKAMLANYAIQKATGTGAYGNVVGLLGRATRFVGGAAGGGGLIGAAVQGPVGAGAAGIFQRISMFATRLIPLGGVLVRLIAVGGVLAFAVGAFLAIKNNVLGVRTYLLDLWQRLTLRFKGITIALQPLFNAFSSSGVMGKFFSQVIVGIIHGLGAAVEGLMSMLHTLIHVFAIIAEDGMGALTKPVLLWQTAANAAKADMAIANRMAREKKARDAAAEIAERKAPLERDRQPVFDFRGSRFDIKQAFADVDPDRIAVAFSNNLAAMGERRVQSSFAPLWST